MNLTLVKASHEYKDLIVDMLEEWTDFNANHRVNTSPAAIFRNPYDDFDYYRENLDLKNPGEGLVPDSTYFALDTDRNRMVGAIVIRHDLNEYLLHFGGHIGYGIRPSERRKGYAPEMIKLSLRKCEDLGIQSVLIICDRDNIGSAKAIKNNGGVLENEVPHEGENLQRYWITLEE